MHRTVVILCLMAISLIAFACNGLNALKQQDYSGKPTHYAVVNKEPNPRLVGCYLRSRPSQYRHPNRYEFCLVKESGQYAMFYFVMNGKTMETFKDWTPATIDGDSVTAGYDGSRYFVQDDAVWQMTTSGGPHRMLRMN